MVGKGACVAGGVSASTGNATASAGGGAFVQAGNAITLARVHYSAADLVLAATRN
jgi:hypothetical protein